MKAIRVQTLFLHRFVNRRNSDYGYYQQLKRLSEYGSAEVRLCESWPACLMGNGWYLLRAACNRSGLLRRVADSKTLTALGRTVFVPPGWAARSDLLYTNWYFPLNRIGVPILLDADFCPFGIPAVRERVQRLLHLPRWMIERASGILVRHEKSYEAFARMYPEHAAKARVIPFFHPYLDPIAPDDFARKWNGSPPTRFLFVGRQAVRKGLPALLEGWSRFRSGHPRAAVELTVVSSFDDGQIEIPPGVRVVRNATSAELQALFRAAHVFVMPTAEEAYGRVFVEALNYGCVLIAPDWEPARTLWRRFGECVAVDSAPQIAQTLASFAARPELGRLRASENLAYYRRHFHPEQVAKRYLSVFEEFRTGSPAGRGGAGP